MEGEDTDSASVRETGSPITLADALAFAKRWCENSPSMLAFDAVQVELWHSDRERKQWQASSGQVIGSRQQAEKDLQFWLLKAKTGQTPSRPGSGAGRQTSSSEKKEKGVAAAHPLAVPPCAEWKDLAKARCAREGIDDVSWIDEASWQQLSSDDKQFVWDEWKQRNEGGNAA